MLSKRSFRILVAVELALIVLGGTAYFAGAAFLPEPLRAFDEARFEADFTPLEAVAFALGVPTLIALLAAIGGLWNFRPFARPLYLGATIAGILITPLFGPHIATGWTAAIESASVTVNGVLLGVIYFSPVRDYFAKPAATSATT